MEGKSFAVLGIVAALSIGLVAIFVTLGFVPLAAEEPELSLLPVEESQLSLLRKRNFLPFWSGF